MIDLHSHTHYSDGSLSPEELLEEAAAARLDALAITDHDDFGGYDAAIRLPRPAGLDLLCGLELTTRAAGQTVHLLGYWLSGEPGERFREWIEECHQKRRDRNQRLVRRLQELGLDIELGEAEALGRRMTGRPHFARVMMQKGYATSYDDAFDRYLTEDGAAFVRHDAPPLEEGIERILASGGIPSLAHPVRVRNVVIADFLAAGAAAGLQAVEVFHSDHSGWLEAEYLKTARKLGLAVTGGSDFHGAVKPKVRLGSVRVENWVLQELRTRFAPG